MKIMYILRITPIAIGLPENVFTYFSKEYIPIGSLVEIKIKNRKLSGIVISCKDLAEEKMDIKNASFTLKKIEKILQKNFIEEKTLISLNNIATLSGTNLSNLISNFTLKGTFESIIKNNQKETLLLPINIEKENIFIEENKNFIKNKIIIDKYGGRLKVYKNIIRESLAKKESLVIYFSTINELENAKEEIEKGIEKYCISFHSDLSEKILKENLEKLNKENAPLIILSTPSITPFLIKEKINLQNIILEKENSYYYFTHNSKVQIDTRVIIKNLSKYLKLNLILGAEMPSLETYLDFKNKKIEEVYKNTFNALGEFGENIKQNNIKIIDMRKKEFSKNQNLGLYDKVYFEEEIVNELEKLKTKNEGHAFIFAKRKGLYVETVCNDCNSIYKCDDCDKPFVLFNNKNRIYICPSCKKKKELKAEEELICKNCLSWNMRPLGIATEGIKKNLEENGFKVFILDSENIKTKSKARKIIKEWQKEKLAILVGTELAINFLNKNMEIDFILSCSMDSMFSIPEINIDEKILNIIIDLKDKLKWEETEKSKNKNNLYINTRLPENLVWKYTESENYLKFLEEELLIRKELSLPPFINILKITLDQKRENLKEYIEKIFKTDNINIIWHKEAKSQNFIAVIFIEKKLWEEIDFDGKPLPSLFSKKVVNLLSNFKLEVNPVNLYS